MKNWQASQPVTYLKDLEDLNIFLVDQKIDKQACHMN